MPSPEQRSCYNNPAFCNQFDSSLYDYEYVPEIDPDSPDMSRKTKQDSKMVHHYYGKQPMDFSDEFGDSDESNRSIIIEERNNRRVMMICEKRNRIEAEAAARFYEGGRSNGAYYQDVSLDSEEGLVGSCERNRPRIAEHTGPSPRSAASQVKPPSRHRYEDISVPPPVPRRQVHRYAEISTDENGYPNLEHEVEVELADGYLVERYSAPSRPTSPITYSNSYQRTISPRPEPGLHSRPNSPSTPYARSPNLIEMFDFSPPRSMCQPFTPRQKENSSFRQPPIGASSPIHTQEAVPTKRATPSRTGNDKLKQVFHVKTTTSKTKGTKPPKTSTPRGKVVEFEHELRPPTRRNISSAFVSAGCKQSVSPNCRSSLREVPKRTTAIITPILQRKPQHIELGFQKRSQMFQSTGNLQRAGSYKPAVENLNRNHVKSKMKRNQSVPNFTQSFAEAKSTPKKIPSEDQVSPRKDRGFYERRPELHYSPTKSLGRHSPLNRSRLSLIDQMRTSWSSLRVDTQGPPFGCLLVAAVIQVVTGAAICGVSFYLLSKLGRRYYLDFSIIAGCVSFTLGILGFRAQCWRWLPNRNYVSGYIVLSSFSLLACGGLILLITARPMAGDPLLDVTGGAICGFSALIIVLAMTGLTMSSCCKTPPPDNRVNHV